MIKPTRKIIFFNIILLHLLLFASCKPSIPDGIIKPSKIEEILYDIHLADAYAINEGGDFNNLASSRLAYRQSVFNKYNITEQQFDKSMEYYYRHSDRLQNIYENIAARLTDNVKMIGGNVIDFKRTFSAQSDTSNLWTLADHKLLLPYTHVNRYDFCFDSDSSYHKGDTFILMFKSQYVLQEGSRSAIAMLNIQLDNDSIISRLQHINSDTDYNLPVHLPDNRHAKRVYGFIFVGNGGLRDNLSTLKLLNIYNIALLKIHRKEDFFNNNLNNATQ